MPFSSGTFTLVAGNPVVTGTTISSTWANNTLNDIANNGLSNCLLKDGTQTVTANIPMATYKLTGLGAGTSNGDSLRYEQGMQSVLTTTGDMILASAANTAARLPAAATVAAHATTMNPWVARQVTLSGGAVTFTDIANAPYVGASVLLTMNAAHTFTDNANLDVQGGANYTAAAGDQVLLVATAVDAFDVTIFKADGTAVVASSIGRFTSSQQTITSAGALTIAHGLGSTPLMIRLTLVCQTGEHGYSANDVLVIAPGLVDTGSNQRGISIVLDATNISVRFATDATVFAGLNKTTGAATTLTNANWKLVVSAIV